MECLYRVFIFNEDKRMKYLITLLFLFSNNLLAEDIAIEAVKKNPKIIELLSNKPLSKYSVDFHMMELGGQCGFTGCQWRKLVSLIVTSKAANAPSTTILALVSGYNPNIIKEISINFVALKKAVGNDLPIERQF